MYGVVKILRTSSVVWREGVKRIPFVSHVQEEVVESPDVHFDPIVKLAPVETKTLEEDEEEVFKMWA